MIDTPGLLDRPLDERNEIELQAISALRYVGDVLLFIVDPSEECGFTMAEQEKLLDEVRHTVNIPVLVVANKIDVAHVETNADMQMSTLTGEGVATVKDRLVEMLQQAPPREKLPREEEEPEDSARAAAVAEEKVGDARPTKKFFFPDPLLVDGQVEKWTFLKT